MTTFTPTDIQLIGPIFIVFAFAVLAMVLPFTPFLGGREDSTGQLAFALIGLLAATVANVALAGTITGPVLAFSGLVAVDAYAVFVHFAVLLAAAGALLMGHDHMRRLGVRLPEYPALVLFAATGMMLLAEANELVMLFVALEVMSIAIYVLVGINRGEWSAAEGSFKYLVLGAFASAFLLYGIALVYGATGTTRIDALAGRLADVDGLAASPLLAGGVAMMLVGLGFKVAAAPFHMWSPDVYQGAPVPVTAYMASGVKAAAFAAFGRIALVGLAHGRADWVPLLWAMAALTILVGNIVALVQDDLKRMLAYSSIGHAGYLLMAIVATPAGGPSANPRLGGLLFYLLAYTVTTVGAFAALSLLLRDGRDDTRIGRIRGLAARRPLLAAALSVCLLSLAGVPPTLGFVGKFMLLSAAVQAGFPGLAVVGAIGGAIGIYYYLRPMVYMYMKADEGEPEPERSRLAEGLLAVAALALLVLGTFPGPLVAWARASIDAIWMG